MRHGQIFNVDAADPFAWPQKPGTQFSANRAQQHHGRRFTTHRRT
jgi:hypothetical protein